MSDTNPIATETSAGRDRLKRWTSGWLELWLEWPPFRLLLIGVELGSFIVGAVGVWFAAAALDVANEARLDVRISEARQMLLDPPPGLFDLGEAVRTILAAGANLNALSLSCLPGAISPIGPGPRCDPAMHIGEIDLAESRSEAAAGTELPPRQAMRYAITRSQFVGVNFYDSRLDGVGLYEARFYESGFSNVAFSRCRIERSTFSHAYMEQTSFENCEISSTSFAGADFRHASFEGTSMFEVNISGATLCSELICATGLTPESLEGMYFFDDDPPSMTGLLVAGDPKICPSASRATLAPGGVAKCDAPMFSSPDIPAPGEDFPSGETGG